MASFGMQETFRTPWSRGQGAVLDVQGMEQADLARWGPGSLGPSVRPRASLRQEGRSWGSAFAGCN